MSVEAFVENRQIPTTTGQQSKTGLAFQPKLLLGFYTSADVLGWQNEDHIYMSLGAAISATERAAYTVGLIDATDTATNFRRGFKTDRWMTSVRRNTNNEDAGIDLVSMNADGWTHNVVAAPGAVSQALVAAIGGSDFTNLAIATVEAPQNIGDVDTVVGFEPDLVILLLNGRVAPGFGSGTGYMIGAFDGTEQFAAWVKPQTGTVPGDMVRLLSPDHAWYANTPAGTNRVSATGSMLATGFRLAFDFTTDSQDATAIALKGTFQHKLVRFDKTTGAAPAVQDIDCGFPPKFALIVGVQKTAGTALVDHNRITIGLWDGTNQRVWAIAEEDQANPTNIDSYLDAASFAVKVDNPSRTLEAIGVASANGNNLRITWDPNDGVATEYALIVLGDAAGGGGTAHERTITDSLGAVDSVSRVATLERPLTDAEGLVDSVSRTVDSERAQTDLMGMIDSALRAVGYERSNTDSLSMTDAAVAALVFERVATDVLGMTDSLTREAAYGRALTDSLGLADQLLRTHTALRELGDTLGLTDDLTSSLFMLIERTMTDSLGITDSLTRELSLARSVTDPMGLVDSVAQATSFVRSLTDAEGMTDVVERLLGLERSITDTLGLLDSIEQASLGVGRNLTVVVGLEARWTILSPRTRWIIGDLEV